MDIIEIILNSGLVVQGVLIILAVASIVSWAIIFKKKSTFKKIKKQNLKFLRLYYNSDTLGSVYTKLGNLPDSPYKIMFVEGFEELERLKKVYGKSIRSHLAEFNMGSLERSLKKGANESNLSNSMFLSTLASVGSVSPFIGLFGTVWGIIKAFSGLASGGATLDAVAPGIAEALVATAIGLFAAIPAVWYFNKFSNELDRLNLQMESFGEGFLNNVERSLN